MLKKIRGKKRKKLRKRKINAYIYSGSTENPGLCPVPHF